MAFNFNWLPLDTSSTTSSAFYEQAKSLLTAALNKSAKPPIIVDDILVDDLNLGVSAPDLEILEIGDIAEDRFRGIFRMNYAGDAFLTLRTKVQANPLNTYLSTTPAFTSPGPLVANSPLTIPVQITLSHFKLSGFVILVFSKAKGITLVFRNDPLESLKVSSTFDSIPFIANYLQKEIERQVRRIFQEDLPVAVHRLSLRLWNPEYAASLGNETTLPSRPASPSDKDTSEAPDPDTDHDPFASPSLHDGGEDVFTSNNVAHVAALHEAQKTLSLVTPKLRDVVFRAWACGSVSSTQTMWDKPALDFLLPNSGLDANGELPPDLAETRSISTAGTMTPSHGRRPSLSTSISSMSVGTTGSTTPARTPLRRKKKHRVVNLRKTQSTTDVPTTKMSDIPSTGTSTPLSETSESLPPPPPPAFSTVVNSPIQEEEAPVWGPDVKKPQPQRHFRHDSIDYESRPRIDMTAAERQRMLSELGPQVLQQAFIAKLVHEMRMRLKEEHESRAPGEKMWGVERELEQIEGDGLPAYGA